VPGLAFTKYRCAFVNLFCIYAHILTLIIFAAIILIKTFNFSLVYHDIKIQINKMNKTEAIITPVTNSLHYSGNKFSSYQIKIDNQPVV